MAFVNLMDIVYPVGSLYFTTTNVSPSSTIGGTWVKIEDHSLIGSGGSGIYYGDKLISVAAMPCHSHDAHYGFGANVRTNIGIYASCVSLSGYSWANAFQSQDVLGSTASDGDSYNWNAIRNLPDDKRAETIQKIVNYDTNGDQHYCFNAEGHGHDTDNALSGNAGSITSSAGGFAPFYPYQFDCNIYYRTA